MINIKMGQFISELRKSKQMTQKDLAAKLGVTDKSVSKWERGLSCPDISLLAPLSNILGITINELLNGEKSGVEAANIPNAETNVITALQYADKAVRSKARSVQNIIAAVFTGLLILGIITCAIVDMAISGTLTWSLIPISACVFAWLVLIPTIKYDIKGITISLVLLSVLVVPFLLVLDTLVDTGELLMPIGTRASAISIAYLWVVFAISKMLRSQKLVAAATCLLLWIPFSLAINFSLTRVIHVALFDVWDAMAFAITAVVAGVLFFVDYATKKQ